MNQWSDNKKCKGCGACLDIEELKFDNVCQYCGRSVKE